MITRTSANFLLALQNHILAQNEANKDVPGYTPLSPQPGTITRKELVALWTAMAGGPAPQGSPDYGRVPTNRSVMGPLGMAIRWPAWLTNDQNSRVERGVFSLPWAEFNTFMESYRVQNEARAKLQMEKAQKRQERAAAREVRAKTQEAQRVARIQARAERAQNKAKEAAQIAQAAANAAAQVAATNAQPAGA